MTYNFDGKLLKFDQKKIPLLDIVLDFFRMNSISEIFKNLNNDEIYKKLYTLEKTKKFSDEYKKLIKVIEVELGTGDFYFQKIPSFRVHRVKGNSVNYHNDCMYGHGEDVVNIWVPLINTNEHNTLHLADNYLSKKEVKRFGTEKLSLIQANKLFKSITSPRLVNYGEILLFNTSAIHGTEINNSNEDRISFDFRILAHGGDPSTKQLNDFYLNNKSEERLIKKIPCMYYLNKKNPLMKNCSHSIQREIMNTYASLNNFSPEGKEESEIHGTSHYPVIFHYIEEEKNKNILMASILCLPSDQKLRKQVLILAKNNGVNLHFSLENKISKNLSIESVDAFYESILVSEIII